MTRRLKMDTVQAIKVLAKLGWSQRRIAEELGIHRTTVAGSLHAKPTKVTLGPDSAEESSAESLAGEKTEPAEVASRSRCETYREAILQKWVAGLSAQRIYQDLVVEHGLEQSY